MDWVCVGGVLVLYGLGSTGAILLVVLIFAFVTGTSISTSPPVFSYKHKKEARINISRTLIKGFFTIINPERTNNTKKHFNGLGVCGGSVGVVWVR